MIDCKIPRSRLRARFQCSMPDRMAAHRRRNRSRVYLYTGGFRKRDGGSNRKWGGGSDDFFPFSSQTQSEPNLAWAFPSTGEMTLHMVSRLSAFTVMIRFITSSDVMCSDLWGKEARNNSAILRAWDRFSQLRTMTVKTLEVVEFIEASESLDGMCAPSVIRPSKDILARFWRFGGNQKSTSPKRSAYSREFASACKALFNPATNWLSNGSMVEWYAFSAASAS